jgi:hypothetical protein
MSFDRINELTVHEAMALAFVEFGHNRFTTNNLTTYLCSFLSDAFKVRTLRLVEEMLRIALGDGLVQHVPGPKGGAGFAISPVGAEVVSDVCLPREKFERRAEAEVERRTEAQANPGPVFTALLKTIPTNEYRDRSFIESVRIHWLVHGWLSSKQVIKMAAIGMSHGEYIDERHYVGSSLETWREPYIKEFHRLQAEQRARLQAAALARENERRERQRLAELIKEENAHVKATLKDMERTGKLACLDALVNTVFPDTNLSPNAKSAAFAGHGAHKLRVCIAAIAFGRPPALAWKSARYKQQPDAESPLWKELIESAAFRALNCKLENPDDQSPENNER